jgi:hypothetical protein
VTPALKVDKAQNRVVVHLARPEVAAFLERKKK